MIFIVEGQSYSEFELYCAVVEHEVEREEVVKVIMEMEDPELVIEDLEKLHRAMKSLFLDRVAFRILLEDLLIELEVSYDDIPF